MNKVQKIKAIFSIGAVAIAIAAITPTTTVKANIAEPPTEYTLLSPLPCIPTPEKKDSKGNVISPANCMDNAGQVVNKAKYSFKDYIRNFFNLVVALGAVMAVLMIVWNGFQYMTSDSISKKGASLNAAKNAIMGLALILGSYLILRTIDPRLVQVYDTLVPPLKIRCPDNQGILIDDPKCTSVSFDYANYLDKIAGIARDYKVDIQNQDAAIKAKQDQMKTLVTQKNELLYDRGLAEGSSEVRNIEMQIARLAEEIRNAQNNLNTNIFSSASDVELTKLRDNPNLTRDDILLGANHTQYVYDQLVSETKDPASLQSLRDQRDVDMMAFITKYTEFAKADKANASSYSGMYQTLRTFMPSNPDKQSQAVTLIRTAQNTVDAQQAQNNVLQQQGNTGFGTGTTRPQ